MPAALLFKKSRFFLLRKYNDTNKAYEVVVGWLDVWAGLNIKPTVVFGAKVCHLN